MGHDGPMGSQDVIGFPTNVIDVDSVITIEWETINQMIIINVIINDY